MKEKLNTIAIREYLRWQVRQQGAILRSIAQIQADARNRRKGYGFLAILEIILTIYELP